jgi:hypothetical protein
MSLCTTNIISKDINITSLLPQSRNKAKGGEQ